MSWDRIFCQCFPVREVGCSLSVSGRCLKEALVFSEPSLDKQRFLPDWNEGHIRIPSGVRFEECACLVFVSVVMMNVETLNSEFPQCLRVCQHCSSIQLWPESNHNASVYHTETTTFIHILSSQDILSWLFVFWCLSDMWAPQIYHTSWSQLLADRFEVVTPEATYQNNHEMQNVS